MWKSAPKSVMSNFNKDFFRGNSVLSTKAPLTKHCNCLLKITPVLIDRFNRYYGFCKSTCGKFSKGKKHREGPKEKKNSFLGGFDNNVFDALTWSGVFVLGYYFLQPFRQKGLSRNYNSYKNLHSSKLSSYQTTVNFFYNAFGVKTFNCVLPEVKAAKTKPYKKEDCNNLISSKTPEAEENYISLEKAQQKVVGVLSNWLGIQHMESGNHKEALQFFIQAASEENPAGIFNLGICHEKGLGTSQNFKKAAELYQKATDLGHAAAMYNLGVFYAQGLGGVETNMDHARELFKAAASLGQKDAKKALISEKEVHEESSDKSYPVLQKEVENHDSTFCSSNMSHKCTLNLIENLKISIENGEFSETHLSDFDEERENDSYDNDSGVLDLSNHAEVDGLHV